MIVILIGYMASGKSSLGKLLSKKLNYQFIDLDHFIEEKENMSVSEIFKTKGEIYFRKLESVYLKNIIEDSNNLILSVGGGTPCYSGNMDTILKAKNVKSIYLKASLESLVKRLNRNKSKRPLIAHIETDALLNEFIGKHLFERSQYYELADIKITTDNKTKKEIVKELISSLF